MLCSVFGVISFLFRVTVILTFILRIFLCSRLGSISVLMKYKNPVLRFLLLIHYITFQDLLPLSEVHLPYMKNEDDCISLLGLF